MIASKAQSLGSESASILFFFLDQLESRVFPFVIFRFINESFIGVVSAHIVVFVVQWAAGSFRYGAFNH